MKNDWRKPFLELQEGLLPLYKANLSIHHAVLLSMTRSMDELKPVIEMLEPAYPDRKLAKVIPVHTLGCTCHCHVFFADDRKGLDQLGRLLDGIEVWMDDVPNGFIPGFEIPSVNSQVDRNLIRWLAAVYHLAWGSDKPYLDLEEEFEQDIDRIGFLPWTECPQPPGCRPIEWLTHRSAVAGKLPKIKQHLVKRNEVFPDIVDAYLTGEFIASSIAAIDILAYVMHGQRKRKPVDQEDCAVSLMQAKHGRTKADKEVDRLKVILLHHHNPVENTDIELDPEKPLTADQIGKLVGWVGNPRTVASRVSRAMKEFFGRGPMKKYKAALKKGIRSERPEGTSLLYHAIVDPASGRK